MPLGGFDIKPTEKEEQDFLKAAKKFANSFSTTIQQLPDVPEQLINISNQLREAVQEAASLAWEDPPKQVIDAKLLIDLCPRSLLIKDADVELIPDSILISQMESAEGTTLYKSLLKIANIAIADLTESNITKRERTLRVGERKVNEFLKQWTQEKLEVEFIVEQDNLLFHITGKEGHYGKISERSEGLRWFLSFCLSYGSSNNPSHRITLLLDEPGLHLHASAQKDLLELFESVAQNSQIIYTTHSPFMINKNYPERIRGIIKLESPKGTTVDNKPYQSIKGCCYEPIRSSIGLTLGNSLFIGGSNLIVEGIADQIILTAFSRFLARRNEQPFIDLQKICITPAGSADNVPYYAYLCSTEDMKSVVLLDNDTEGDKAFNRIGKDKVFPPNKVVRVRDAVSKPKENIIELEDLIDRKFYHSSFLEAYQELPKIEFIGDLPKNIEEMNKQSAGNMDRESKNIEENGGQTKPKSGRKNKDLESSSEYRGITKLYSSLFRDHENKGWGSFDKVLVAKKISESLEEEHVPNDNTILNFANLFSKINEMF